MSLSQRDESILRASVQVFTSSIEFVLFLGENLGSIINTFFFGIIKV